MSLRGETFNLITCMEGSTNCKLISNRLQNALGQVRKVDLLLLIEIKRNGVTPNVTWPSRAFIGQFENICSKIMHEVVAFCEQAVPDQVLTWH